MDKYTRGHINEMRDKMKYLIDYDVAKTRDDNQLVAEEMIESKRVGDPGEGLRGVEGISDKDVEDYRDRKR
jgi:hypothetical protein